MDMGWGLLAGSGSPEPASHSLQYFVLFQKACICKSGKMAILDHMGHPKQCLKYVPTKNIWCPNFQEGGRGSENFRLSQFSTIPIRGRGGRGQANLGQCPKIWYFFYFEGLPKLSCFVGFVS